MVQKNNKERVNVYIDHKFAFAVTLNVALSLKKGQVLDEAEIARLTSNDIVDRAYEQALHYLGYRPRTRQEVKRHLQKKTIPDEAIEIVIDRLDSQNYLNDAEFGRLWAENRALHNPKGRRALQYELRQKGLTETEIEQALEDLDEEALAWQAVRKRLTRWQSLDELTLRKKLTSYLARRGFDYEIINLIFNQVREEQGDNTSND